jgi:hypothetical protein
MTLGSEDDILIDGDLRADASKPVLGLIANRFVRVKHDVYGSPCRNNTDPDSPHRVRQDYYIEAAIRARIAQKFRGPVGTFYGTTLNSGYTKDYNYNDALRYRSPPYFLDPMQAAWRVVRANEQVPAAE